MEAKFNIIPKPDVPNRNSVTTTHNALAQAIDKYWKWIDSGRAFVMDGYPKWDGSSVFETDLSRVAGQIVDIEYDAKVHGYVAKVKMLNTPSGKLIQKLVKGESELSVAFNRAGCITECTNDPNNKMYICDDPALRICSASFDIDKT